MKQDERRFENRRCSSRLQDKTVFQKRARSTFTKYDRNGYQGEILKTLELHSQAADTHGKLVREMSTNKRKCLEPLLHRKTEIDSVPDSCKEPMIGAYFV